jgi:hypothetical protein
MKYLNELGNIYKNKGNTNNIIKDIDNQIEKFRNSNIHNNIENEYDMIGNRINSKNFNDINTDVNSLDNEINLNTDKININIPDLKNTIEFTEKSNDLIKEHNYISKKITNELNRKKKMIASHERMLQTSQDKNIYKEKLMYSYIALIISIIVLLLVSFYYFKI